MDDTLKSLEMGAVETLIVWENLEVTRYVLKDHSNECMCIPHSYIIAVSNEIHVHVLDYYLIAGRHSTFGIYLPDKRVNLIQNLELIIKTFKSHIFTTIFITTIFISNNNHYQWIWVSYCSKMLIF